jgi:ATP-binding cassette subfamily G (WHITE) protein 2 (SNQ2)
METPASDARTLRDDSLSGQIDVVQAEADFHQLERSLSRYTNQSIEKSPQDLEKANNESAEIPFNLREYLSSANDASAEAGIKHKHVGVTWEDVEVTVVGGTGHKVCTIRYFHTTVLTIV